MRTLTRILAAVLAGFIVGLIAMRTYFMAFRLLRDC
jgi:hypothetical protein